MTLSAVPRKIKRGLRVYSKLYLRREMPILIYTTGRVGSMALNHALKDHLAIQLHSLNPAKLLDNQQPGTAVWAYHHIVKPGRAAKIINIVRDPLAIMVSDFFPKLRWITGQADAYHQLSIEELCHLFNTRYLGERHQEKLNWFDQEMNAQLGIDVYSKPFSYDLGYTRFAQPPFDIFIMRTELDDAVKAQALAEFVGVAKLNIERRNVGESKTYGEIYRAFKAQLLVPDDQLDVVYESRFASHFYSPEERRRMRSAWSPLKMLEP
jgi:hypothetical protein